MLDYILPFIFLMMSSNIIITNTIIKVFGAFVSVEVLVKAVVSDANPSTVDAIVVSLRMHRKRP